jgi:ribose transport system substrate-binding protein
MRACLLASFVLALACGGGSEAPAPSSGAPSTSIPPSTARRTIAVIPKGTTHVFWRSVHAGALRAANELNVDVVWQGPQREDDRAGQIRVVEDMITRHVDAIVLAPLDATALVPVANEARGEHIPVVVIDSGMTWDGLASFVATDNRAGGALAAERIGTLLGGHGSVIVMRYQEGSDSTMQRETGFLEALRAHYPEISIVSDNQYGGATTESAYATAESLLVRFTEVDAAFTPNESTTFGMLRALRDASRAGEHAPASGAGHRVRLVGFDANEAMVDALRAGDIDGLVLQDPERMGELGVRTAVQVLDGQHVEARVDTGATMVTRENMDEPAVHRLLAPDLSVLDGH